MGTRCGEGQGLGGGRGVERKGGGGIWADRGSNGEIHELLLACLLGTIELPHTPMSMLSA